MGILDQLTATQAQPGLGNLGQNTLFNVGLGLLSARDDARINPFQAVGQGIASAQAARTAAEAEEQKRLERENLAKLREGASGLIGQYTAAGHPGLEDMPGAALSPEQRQVAQLYEQMAQYGDPTAAATGFVDYLGEAGIAGGPAGSDGLPKSVQEWEFYNALPEEQQKRYLEMKRGQQIMDIAGQKVRIFGDLTSDDILSTLDDETRALVRLKGAGQLGLVYGKKFDLLKSSGTQRRENYASAQRILQKIKDRELKTGLYTGLLYKVLPTSDQEELDALAEFAARERLKASGEIRPTDADVEGAKRALFGSNLTEDFNRRSLERLLREIESQQHEFEFLSDYFGAVPQSITAEGQAPTVVPGTQQEQGGGVLVPEPTPATPPTGEPEIDIDTLQGEALIEEAERMIREGL